ncbi:hypothetical protein ACFL6H_09765 [Candidatus Latescibacterota bacterium]
MNFRFKTDAIFEILGFEKKEKVLAWVRLGYIEPEVSGGYGRERVWSIKNMYQIALFDALMMSGMTRASTNYYCKYFGKKIKKLSNKEIKNLWLMIIPNNYPSDSIITKLRLRYLLPLTPKPMDAFFINKDERIEEAKDFMEMIRRDTNLLIDIAEIITTIDIAVEETLNSDENLLIDSISDIAKRTIEGKE